MSANKIAETSTSTGTGDFTLDGAWSQAGTFNTGNRSFNSFYGLNHYFPYMIQDTAGNWEKGRGYLSAAATLVRDTVTDNSLGTTDLINFGAGAKLVMIPVDAGADWSLDLQSGCVIQSAHVFNSGGGAQVLTNDRVFLTPFLVKRPFKITSAQIEVTTAVASSSVRAALYSAKALTLTAANLRKITTDAVFDSTTTGAKSSGMVGTAGAGMYVIAVVSSGGPSLRWNSGGAGHLDFGMYTSIGSSTGYCSRQDIAGAGSALPSSITGTTIASFSYTPRVYLGGSFL